MARYRVDGIITLAPSGVTLEHHVIVGGVVEPGEALVLARAHLERSRDVGSIGDLKASYVGERDPR